MYFNFRKIWWLFLYLSITNYDFHISRLVFYHIFLPICPHEMLDWSLFHCTVPVPLLLNDPFWLKMDQNMLQTSVLCHFYTIAILCWIFRPMLPSWQDNGAHYYWRWGYDIFSCRGWVMFDQLCWRLLFLFWRWVMFCKIWLTFRFYLTFYVYIHLT